MVTNRFFTPLAGLPNSRLIFAQSGYANVIAGTWSFQDFLDFASKAAQSDKQSLNSLNARQILLNKLPKIDSNTYWQKIKKKPKQQKINPQKITFDLSPDFAQAPPLAAVANTRSCKVSG